MLNFGVKRRSEHTSNWYESWENTFSGQANYTILRGQQLLFIGVLFTNCLTRILKKDTQYQVLFKHKLISTVLNMYKMTGKDD